MKKLLFSVAVLAVVLFLPSPAEAACYEENYGGGSCATTCVDYNDQGSVVGWRVRLHAC
jgi:hypothetical protein